ncbi:hypothetical protein BC938DRAFT_475712 [Jimgerdemannia flammicorona]|uniref:Uncharacterized protein n=1 Tax=Jimgerdemannia flammicorona TaxID=994334 RepID=A0A433PPT0_9FUNG|nr:hypothetical protein BC938DRAFT_475712 [Jimgerdemannia flammicorona]
MDTTLQTFASPNRSYPSFSEGPSYPFPPFSNSGPYILIPTALLLFLFVAGIHRYYTVLRSVPDSNDPARSNILLPSGRTRRDARLVSHDTTVAKFVYTLSFLITLTFLVDAAILCLHALIEHQWTSSALAYYDGASWLAWTVNSVLLLEEKRRFGKWSWVQYTFWTVGILVISSSVRSFAVYVLRVKPYSCLPPLFPTGTVFSNWDYILYAFFTLRYLTLLALVLATFVYATYSAPDPELVAPVSSSSASYGTFAHGGGHHHHSGGGEEEPTDDENRSAFAGFFDKMRRLIPFIWPKKDHWLQFLIIVCVGLLIVGRIVNVLTPMQLGRVVGELTAKKRELFYVLVIALIFGVDLKFAGA